MLRTSSKLLLLLLSGLNSQLVFSGTMGEPTLTSYVATISAGPIWHNAGQTQTFFLTPDIEKSYVANQSSKVLADAEVFLGLQRALNPKWQGQFGIAVAATSSAKLSGVIWDDANPRFDNYTYEYKLQHSHVALKGKLLVDMNSSVTPWISGSVGVGFNRAYSFTNTPTIFEAIVNPNFSSNHNTTFTYTVGVGVQKALNTHWQAGVGYEFADWGKSHLGRAAGQTLNSGLGLTHLYTNGLLFNITYLT